MVDDAWTDEAIAKYERIEALQGRFQRALKGTEVAAHSPDGLVEIVVTAGGEFRSVVIHEPALAGRSARELSTLVLKALIDAQHAADWARKKLHRKVFADYPSVREGRS